MVKGISKQVILVKSPNPDLFEQAIFILSENALKKDGVTDRELLREANAIAHHQNKKKRLCGYGIVCGCIGAALVGAVWLITFLI